jgi:hypothetical protein
MASSTKNDALKAVRQRKFLNKDFDGLRADLIEYARTFYGENVNNDFSEASLGGMMVDLAAYVGDVMSFYLDHQFSELDPDFAVETANIERLLKKAGVEITGASPAVVDQSFYIVVPATVINGVSSPVPSALPVIESGSIVSSDGGIEYILLENIDFSETDSDGNLLCDIEVGDAASDGTPRSFVLKKTGLCISGKRTQENFTIGSFVKFREITLLNSNVTEIESVYDSLGNVYYEVGSLSQDTVYARRPNPGSDADLVPEILELRPAPYRFTKSTNLDNRTTTLTFGGGSAETIEDDVIPDPSEFALPLYGKTTFPRISIDPQQLITTRTLGVASSNTTLTINYRYGGGLNHNAEANTIRNIKTLGMTFPTTITSDVAAKVRGSAATKNTKRASGGDDPPDIDELKTQIPNARNSQSRIVTKPDLISRIYLMPANFGRVFRAATRQNANNPLASLLYVISRDENSNLIVSPDALKDNLRKYLNDYRMISDAIDIVDAQVINLRVIFEATVDNSMNKKVVLQNIIQKIQKYFNIKNFQIDQPIVLSDIHNIIYNNVGVLSVNKLKIENLFGTNGNRTYSEAFFDVDANTTRGMIVPPAGSIFEVKYPEFDVIGKAV